MNVEMYKIEHKPEFMKMMASLTHFTEKMIVRKVKGKDENGADILTGDIVVRAADDKEGSNLFYSLRVPEDNFNFPGEKFTFTNYPAFYKFYSFLKNGVEIYYDGEYYMALKQGRQNLNYRVSAKTLVNTQQPEDITIPFPVSIFIPAQGVEDLKAMINMVQPDIVNVSYDAIERHVVIDFKTEYNEYAVAYDVTDSIEGCQSFVLGMKTNVFKKLPFKEDYKVSFHPHVVRFNHISDDKAIEFNMYSIGATTV